MNSLYCANHRALAMSAGVLAIMKGVPAITASPGSKASTYGQWLARQVFLTDCVDSADGVDPADRVGPVERSS